jgi:ABC-type multidrug transport system fused ATPase/permease subunit
MAFVFQDVILFNDTVYNNIRIGNLNATEGEVIAAARSAGWCAHRIEELLSGDRIIRPAYRTVTQRTPYVFLEDRG